MSLHSKKKEAGSHFQFKTALDDFKHLSRRLHILFIDFAGAHGSI